MDRQHRHDLKHDKFVDEIGAWSVRARDNQRMLLTGGGAVVLIAVIAFGLLLPLQPRENAQQALAPAIETAGPRSAKRSRKARSVHTSDRGGAQCRGGEGVQRGAVEV
jgi:hypothetical protein